MTYIVNDNCIKCKLTDCVDVCPVECFYEGKNMLVIKSDQYTDYGVYKLECPVETIKPDTEEGAEKWVEINTKYSEIWPNINKKMDPLRTGKNLKMKKMNLKNILKKTFKKKLSKNMKKKKTKKVKKVTKKIKNKIVKKRIPKKQSKRKLTENNVKIEKKNDNLRIPKNNEHKPEIKKIKKQQTAKKEYKSKDYIVYPKHGVGQIQSINTKTIGEIEVQCYDIKFEKDKAIGLLPINKQHYLRPLSSTNQLNKCIAILKSKPKIKRTMWSRRAQEYEQKITSGKIYDLAEVVRDLNKGDDLMIDQSYSERQLFEKAYERILSEFKIVMNLSLEDTQKKIDKALKRNLETQIPKAVTKKEEIIETATSESV